jgi:hypothetical protein
MPVGRLKLCRFLLIKSAIIQIFWHLLKMLWRIITFACEHFEAIILFAYFLI